MVNITHSRMNRFNYKTWTRYFMANDKKRLQIDFSGEKELTEAEKKLIFPSIQAFQKGEGSDGAFLMRAVEDFAYKNHKEGYIEAMRQFVKEENWHSAYLKKYMDHYGVKSKDRTFLDECFRKLRKLGGIKCEITVLVTAEMIALTYYDALSRCTASPALKAICAQMLHDELPHIMFQSYTLSQIGNGWFDQVLRVFFMTATLLTVWIAFHEVYLHGGYNFSRYIRENMGYLRQSIFLTRQSK
ncbi:MAG: hypothetical protein K2O32_07965 [Acetatifactor sp.]|nr:hypothetical protein [Acetatifactor sp.]